MPNPSLTVIIVTLSPFVRYAQDHDLRLDFTTPPKRPDPRETVERMIQILDESER